VRPSWSYAEEGEIEAIQRAAGTADFALPTTLDVLRAFALPLGERTRRKRAEAAAAAGTGAGAGAGAGAATAPPPQQQQQKEEGQQKEVRQLLPPVLEAWAHRVDPWIGEEEPVLEEVEASSAHQEKGAVGSSHEASPLPEVREADLFAAPPPPPPPLPPAEEAEELSAGLAERLQRLRVQLRAGRGEAERSC